MIGDFEVRYTEAARDDLLRLFDFLLERAETLDALHDAQEVIDALRTELETRLARAPFIYRKAAGDASPFRRELIVPFRRGGYVVLYEIEGSTVVNILAVRHQLEDDYH
jgi:plasmid stabilization system protein ParE